MFLKKYTSNIIVIIIIFCISFISSYYLKNGYLNKKILSMEYKFPNYFLLTQKFIHPYIELVNEILEKEQYLIRDKVLRSEECEFLSKDVTSFLITKDKFDTYKIDMATNIIDPNNNLNSCLNSYLFEIEDLKKKLYEQALSSDLNSTIESIDYYENLLSSNKSDIETAYIINILSDIRILENNVKEMKRFLKFINKTNAVDILYKEVQTFEIHPVIIFVLTFTLLLTLYLIFRKLYLSKNLINKIFN